MCSTCGGHTDPTDATPSANESRLMARINASIAVRPLSNAMEVQMDFTEHEIKPLPKSEALPEAAQSLEMTDLEKSDYAAKVFYQAKPERTNRPRKKRK